MMTSSSVSRDMRACSQSRVSRPPLARDVCAASKYTDGVKELIDSLHAQHEEIKRLIKAIDAALERADESEVRRELDALSRALLAHLAIEDEHLYPSLSRASEERGHDVPSRVARTYEHNMQTITVALKAFLEAYSGTLSLPDFSRDWALVSQLLTDRIASEERTLYPLYNEWLSRNE